MSYRLPALNGANLKTRRRKSQGSLGLFPLTSMGRPFRQLKAQNYQFRSSS